MLTSYQFMVSFQHRLGDVLRSKRGWLTFDPKAYDRKTHANSCFSYMDSDTLSANDRLLIATIYPNINVHIGVKDALDSL